MRCPRNQSANDEKAAAASVLKPQPVMQVSAKVSAGKPRWRAAGRQAAGRFRHCDGAVCPANPGRPRSLNKPRYIGKRTEPEVYCTVAAPVVKPLQQPIHFANCLSFLHVENTAQTRSHIRKF
jgi:hypothetical protein